MQRKLKNTVLKLKNIRAIDGIISADYMPEDKEEVGHVSMNMATKECLSCTETPFEKGFPIYAQHAKQELARLSDLPYKNIPKEKTVLWY